MRHVFMQAQHNGLFTYIQETGWKLRGVIRFIGDQPFNGRPERPCHSHLVIAEHLDAVLIAFIHRCSRMTGQLNVQPPMSIAPKDS